MKTKEKKGCKLVFLNKFPSQNPDPSVQHQLKKKRYNSLQSKNWLGDLLQQGEQIPLGWKENGQQIKIQQLPKTRQLRAMTCSSEQRRILPPCHHYCQRCLRRREQTRKIIPTCSNNELCAKAGTAFIHTVGLPQTLHLDQLIAQAQAICFLASPGKVLGNILMCSRLLFK